MRAAEAAFWRFPAGRLFLNSWNILRTITTMESELSTIVPAKLLNSFSVMRNFLEVSQDISKYGFQYKKHVSGIVSQAYKSL